MKDILELLLKLPKEWFEEYKHYWPLLILSLLYPWFLLVQSDPKPAFVSLLPYAWFLYGYIAIFISTIATFVYVNYPRKPPHDTLVVAIANFSYETDTAKDSAINMPSRIVDALEEISSDNAPLTIKRIKVKVDEADEQASVNKAKKLAKGPYVNAHIVIWGEVRLDSGQLKISPRITVAQKLGGQDLAERKMEGRAANTEPDHLRLKEILAADLADLVALIHGMAWYNAAQNDPAHWDKAIAVLEQVKGAEGQFYKGLSHDYRSERVAKPVDDLRKAVTAFERALEDLTRKDLPQDWAMTQENLGNVLATLGERLEGAEGSEKLEEAVSAFKSALEVRTRKDLPQKWAMTQENLGIAFAEIAKREKGEKGIGYINESIACYDNALSVFDKKNFPYNHRKATDNKNIALQTKAGL